MSDRIGYIITILCSMVLVGSALIARRERLRADGWRMASIWVAIFAALIVIGLGIDSFR